MTEAPGMSKTHRGQITGRRARRGGGAVAATRRFAVVKICGDKWLKVVTGA